MNLYPRGHLGDESGLCNCTAEQVTRYRTRISGPLLDRIDLHVDVCRPQGCFEASREPAESSAAVAKRVTRVRQVQLDRQGCLNAQLAGDTLKQRAHVANPELQFLKTASERLGLSPRSIHRIMRPARHDPVAMPEVGCKNPVEAGQIQSRAWNEGCELGHEVHWLQRHMG